MTELPTNPTAEAEFYEWLKSRGKDSTDLIDAWLAATKAAEERAQAEIRRLRQENLQLKNTDDHPLLKQINEMEAELSAAQEKIAALETDIQLRNSLPIINTDKRVKALETENTALRSRCVRLEGALEKYVKAMDDLYNHNEATRSAVVQYFGIHHLPQPKQEGR